MRFINFSIYVQKQINVILRIYREFVKIYVDDVIVFFQTFEKHLKHLVKIFALFDEMNIVLKFFKFFFEYSSISLLNQKMNNFELITIDEKLKTIINFRFSSILKYLKMYLRKTNYFRQYVSYYAQKTNNFQKRKTKFLKNVSSKRKSRRKYNLKTTINDFFEEKLNSFNQLQLTFNRFFFDSLRSYKIFLYRHKRVQKKRFRNMRLSY